MSTYKIKELYYTLQGEGAHTGRPAVFCRFSGCNLWSGREQDRAQAICQFCDTDFRGTDGENGGTFTADELVSKILSLWPVHPSARPVFVVCTGGEPLLQLDQHLTEIMHTAGIEIAIETNGTLPAPTGIDWICMSPKANTEIVLTKGHELKLVYPQQGIDPKDFEGMKFEHYFIQPMDGPEISGNIQLAIEYCQHHPHWKLSLQSHKLIGLK